MHETEDAAASDKLLMPGKMFYLHISTALSEKYARSCGDVYGGRLTHVLYKSVENLDFDTAFLHSVCTN